VRRLLGERLRLRSVRAVLAPRRQVPGRVPHPGEALYESEAS
jgi:hypothetical protein